MESPTLLPDLLVMEADFYLPDPVRWPFTPVLVRLGMAVATGIFVGLEREHRNKAGVRTFSLIALLGALGGLMGTEYSIAVLAFAAMFVAWMNHRQMLKRQGLVLTTSAALILTAFCGVLYGQGHRFTPAVAGILTAALLSWKRPISNFVGVLTEREVRSAVLLALLSIVVLPVLPAEPMDPWRLVNLRETWGSVVLIAGIGFVNYILMRWLGTAGMEITAFFGGLVNSRKVVVELLGRARELGVVFLPSFRRSVLLTTAAMLLRNVLIVALMAPRLLGGISAPMGAMLAAGAALWAKAPRPVGEDGKAKLGLESPFRLSAALKFGLVFLALNVAGTLAQRQFGPDSFYFVSALGGLLSSASSIATAAALSANGKIPSQTAATGVVLSGLVSIVANIPLLRTMGFARETARSAAWSLVLTALAGVTGLLAARVMFP